MLRAFAFLVVVILAAPVFAEDKDWTGKTIKLKADVKLGGKLNGGLVRDGAALEKGKTFVVKSDAGGFLELVGQTGYIFKSEAEVVTDAPATSADTRAYWVCEGGWFAKTKDGTWYELNELTYRKQGKPSKFKEVSRTKEYVELYDEDRKVGIRLSATEAVVRHSANAPWKQLVTGHWKTPLVE